MNEERSIPVEKQLAEKRHDYTIRYALLGAGFGLFFPLIATIIFLVDRGLALTFSLAIDAQLSEPLLWIIDTAPLFLGIIAALAGRREDRLRRATLNLQQSVNSLEDRVKERTRALNQAVLIGRQLSSMSDLDQMLNDAASLTRSHFGLNKVEIYLTDELGSSLGLRASSGASSLALPTLRRRVPFGFESTVGTAAIEVQTVVVRPIELRASSSGGASHPDVAIPLVIGERVIGVLALVSGQPDGLSTENRTALETLASQFAVAIENVRLISQAKKAREDIENQARRLARSGWQEYLNAVDRGEVLGYSFDLEDVAVVTDLSDLDLLTDRSLGAPITIAGERVGQIEVRAGLDENLSESEAELIAAVAQQVAQQVENLRLLAEADRYRDEAEFATRRLTRQGWDDFLASRKGNESGYTYHLNQVTALPMEPDLGDPGSLASRELTVRGETIGRLEVVEEGEVDEDAAELVESVAAQLSNHLEGLRLSEQTELALAETERQASRLQALNELGQALAGASTIEDVYRIAASRTKAIVPAERTSIAMLMEDGKSFQILALHGDKGVSRVGDVVSVAGSALGIAIREKRVVLVNETAESGIPGVASFMVTPLTAGGRTFGTLNAGHRRPNAFSDQDTRLMVQVASLLASTIESRRLFAQTQQRAEELVILNEMGRALTSMTQIDAVADSVYEHTSRLMETRSFSVVLYDAERSEVDFREYGEGQFTSGATSKRLAGHGLVDYVIQTRQPLLIEEDLKDRLNELGIEADEPLPRSWLGVPMMTGGEVTGAVAVQNFDRSRAFNRHQEGLLAAVASQAAIALENARLFEQVQARARRERILREVTARVRGTSNIDAIMRTAAKEVGQALGRQSFVYLGNGEANQEETQEPVEEEEYGSG